MMDDRVDSGPRDRRVLNEAFVDPTFTARPRHL